MNPFSLFAVAFDIFIQDKVDGWKTFTRVHLFIIIEILENQLLQIKQMKHHKY